MAEEGDEEESLARCGDVEVSVVTQDICAREQSADVPSDNDLHVSVLPSRTVKWYTIPGQHTPNVRSVNSGPSDGPGVDSTRLMEEKVDRFCAKAGHHYVGCRGRRDGQYRRFQAVSELRTRLAAEPWA